MQRLTADHPWVAMTLSLVALVLVAWLADVLVRRIVLGVVRRLAARTRSTWARIV